MRRIKIRDATCGDEHLLPASTPAIYLGKRCPIESELAEYGALGGAATLPENSDDDNAETLEELRFTSEAGSKRLSTCREMVSSIPPWAYAYQPLGRSDYGRMDP